MKLIKEYIHLTDAEEAARNLEKEGIIVHISSKHAHSLSSVVTGSLKVGLWSVLQHQYSDAIALVNDKDHVVTSGLSSIEIDKFKKHAKRNSFNTLAKYSSYALILIVILISIIYYLSNFINGI